MTLDPIFNILYIKPVRRLRTYLLTFKVSYIFLIKSFNIGAEINIDEYVPTINPHIKIYEKSLRATPPNKNIIKTTKIVLIDVINVLVNVLFTDKLILLFISSSLSFLFKFSRYLS